MLNIGSVMRDGLILTGIIVVLMILAQRVNPRLFIQDYPEDIQAAVPPKTRAEKRLTLLIGIPFLLVMLLAPLFSTLSLKHAGASFGALFANAFGVVFFFNLFDLLVLDWLIFCSITPKSIVIPGTEGMAGYKDYGFHFRGFLKGTLLSAILGLLIASGVHFLG